MDKIEYKQKYRRIDITPESSLFSIFQQVIKQVKYPEKTKDIEVVNNELSQKLRTKIVEYYKFIFDWQDENTCSIDMFKKILY
jgi:hypothetical protein